MPHFDEMGFLFKGTTVSGLIHNSSEDNTVNIMKNNNTNFKYTVYKGKNSGTNKIIGFLKDNVYKDQNNNRNPYLSLINDFNSGSMKIKPSDLAYLRDLGVYPINRMAILRRFQAESYLPENLEEIPYEPISTIIGWIKPDDNFGKIDFNESWTKTNKRFDVLLMEVISKQFGLDLSRAVPIPDFAQGAVWEVYKKMGFTTNDSDGSEKAEGGTSSIGKSPWGLNNIPVGNPNLLMEGPFRDPSSQNIQSNFSFNLTTTYEQKLIGDVDPGSAMLDILDNIYAMGTSDMLFYWDENSERINEARKSIKNGANSVSAWFDFIKNTVNSFWDMLQELFSELKEKLNELKGSVKKITESAFRNNTSETTNAGSGGGDNFDIVKNIINSVLTSTLAIHRFHFRASIELMTGGRFTNTPWHLTIGNPYSPWLATNHIIIKSCSVETSKELGFNDQPLWLTATFNCELSRALGKQELMRMFNNTYKRLYDTKQ